MSQIQNYTDSPKGGTAITGQGGAASSVEHDMFPAAVFEERLQAFIGLLEGHHVERKFRPDTIRSESFVVKLQKVKQDERNLVDHILPCNPVFMTVGDANINRAV